MQQMNNMQMNKSGADAAAALGQSQKAFLSHFGGTPAHPPPPQQSPPSHFHQAQAAYQSSKSKSSYQKKKKKKGEDDSGEDDHEEHKGGGGRWTKEEDRKLRAAVAAIGPKNWKRISQEFLDEQRSDVQCLHRWQKVH